MTPAVEPLSTIIQSLLEIMYMEHLLASAPFANGIVCWEAMQCLMSQNHLRCNAMHSANLRTGFAVCMHMYMYVSDCVCVYICLVTMTNIFASCKQ